MDFKDLAAFNVAMLGKQGWKLEIVSQQGAAVDVWNAANVWHLISPSLVLFDNASDIIFHLLRILSTTQIENIVTIIWSIWKARNLKLWQQVTDSTTTIMVRAIHLLEGWRSANRKQNPSNHSHIDTTLPRNHTNQVVDGDSNIRWRKPRSGRLKCNIDASFSDVNNKIGLGMCIRDSKGFHVRSKIMCFSPLGLYHAIRWIHELQLENVDFEVDSKRVADYFNKGSGDVTEFGSIMDSSIHFCRSFLTNSHVEFTRRQANEVAHTLAKAATSSSSFRIFDEIPTCITDLIFNEMI
ncbi:uncharacterized protein [Medicago truncatula]|uniref:uncharacterized protein n=1 Tax=Medicago truncatula TaxID=3880 RepID=UPI000D2F3003|nr:uncharacterized protein LOC112422033 [Medicago truncatula]